MTASWTDDALRTRHRASLRHFYELVAKASESARLVGFDGVTACVVPVTPDRSFTNAVLYDDAGALAAALPDLARLYVDAGVTAWTVWVPEADTEATRVLEDAGHVLDANPLEMAAPLSELDLEPRRALDLDSDADSSTVAAINDTAYGMGGSFVPAFEHFPMASTYRYVARKDGEAVACAVACDLDGDCEICLVATIPEAQGRGLCGELMRTALRDARDRGCDTTSLEASKAGEPIYRRLGYRPLGALQMWERRS